MHDLETMDTLPTASIISIGAVIIDDGKLTHEFKQNIDHMSNAEFGLTTSSATKDWWDQQHPAAKMVFTETIPLWDALANYSAWMKEVTQPFGQPDGVFGNGSDFDNAILAHAYAKTGLSLPWDWFSTRCFRTMKSFFPLPSELMSPFKGTKHDALDDAKNQAEHLIEICKYHDFNIL